MSVSGSPVLNSANQLHQNIPRQSTSFDPLAAGGEMGALMRATDWAAKPVGPVDQWSLSLRMMVSFLLANRFPLILLWGPEFCQFYNDPYRPILGAKHPQSMGQRAPECWAEIWHVIGPLFETPFSGGPATWMEDILLEMNRHGFVEETHFTIAYSPVPNESAPGGIGGVLATVHEITEKVVGERRVLALRDLGKGTGGGKTAEDACHIAAETLGQHAQDIPFALVYLMDEDGKRARLVGSAGVPEDGGCSPIVEIDADEDGWPLGECARSEAMVTVEDIASHFTTAPAGPWSDAPHTAVIVPIKSNTAHQLAGFLIAGASPRLQLDEQYCSFFELAAAQIATAIATARAYEEARKRAEALAEIDRAKTLFFSNVSHEFRTPLTLMLGPLEDILKSEQLPVVERERLTLAYRNSLRLLKLVNSLLDFSRIEANRVQAVYEPVDLAAFTEELASNFRSACERAELKFTVDCPTLSEPVYVDRDMWEKIVLNLLSNAFKFTFTGGITVRVRQWEGSAELSVSDTGIGVPPAELPRLFERFHRIEGQRSRTYEGSGIGLALVQELVRLQGGTITAESELEKGTRFTVSVPFGSAHLPHDRIGAERTTSSTSVRAAAYVEEALKWLPDKPEAGAPLEIARTGDLIGFEEGTRVLVVDDNADMRMYVRRLLEGYCKVVSAPDGLAALELMTSERPDLVLADIMMPRLDGFGLLRAIRAEPELRDIPVIMLSARAGEESRVEGLAEGADDYLVKPFSARELAARVSSNLKLSRARMKDKKRKIGQARILEMVATGVPLTDVLDALILFVEAQETGLICGILLTDDGVHFKPGSGRSLPAAYRTALHEAIKTVPVTPPYFASCAEAVHCDKIVVVPDVEKETRYADEWQKLMLASGLRACRSTPVRATDGRLLGSLAIYFIKPRDLNPNDGELVAMATHVAAIAIERDRVNQSLRLRTAQFETLFNQAPTGVYLIDSAFRIREVNPTALPVFGDISDLTGRDFDEVMHLLWPQSYADEIVRIFRRTLETGEPYLAPERIEERRDRGVKEYYEWQVHRIMLPEGLFGVVCYFRDISTQVAARERLKLLVNELNHRVKNTLATVQSVSLQTLRNAANTTEGAKALEARLIALSKAHDVLTREHWEGADIGELIQRAVSVYSEDGKGGRFTISGPKMWIGSKAVLALSLALHELATNAAKYGALSNETGHIHIEWGTAHDEHFLQWCECGGPNVRPPEKRGFGSRVIERGLVSDLAGSAKLHFEPAGLICRVKAPMKEMLERDAFEPAGAQTAEGDR